MPGCFPAGCGLPCVVEYDATTVLIVRYDPGLINRYYPYTWHILCVGGGCDIKVRLTPLFSSPSHYITLGYVVRRDTSVLQGIRTTYLASKPASDWRGVANRSALTKRVGSCPLGRYPRDNVFGF